MGSSIESFFSAWGNEDSNSRSMAVAGAVTQDCSYADPRTPSPIFGPAALSDYVALFSQAAPGAQAVVIDQQTQQGLTRTTIAFRMADGAEHLGQYFIELNDAGLIQKMTGFVGNGNPS